MDRIRSYRELSRLHSFEDRFVYLALSGRVGSETFGHDRYLNQMFYKSREWRLVRDEVIVRDEARDLGIPGYEIHVKGDLYIHHMNPISSDDIVHRNDDIINPEYLITVTHETHNAIHYGDHRIIPRQMIERRPGDTKLW